MGSESGSGLVGDWLRVSHETAATLVGSSHLKAVKGGRAHCQLAYDKSLAELHFLYVRFSSGCPRPHTAQWLLIRKSTLERTQD